MTNDRPTPETLKQILDDHYAWWFHDNGKRANLSGADLSVANLSGSNLSELTGIRVASCHWTGHGDCGRAINAVELPIGVYFYCGCFSGDEQTLRQYISNGDQALINSRTKALDFLLGCF